MADSPPSKTAAHDHVSGHPHRPGTSCEHRLGWHPKSPPPPRPERVPARQPRALDEVERKEVLTVLHSDEHVDEAPATIYAKLVDQGV